MATLFLTGMSKIDRLHYINTLFYHEVHVYGYCAEEINTAVYA